MQWRHSRHRTATMACVCHARRLGLACDRTAHDICVNNVSILTNLLLWVCRFSAYEPYGVEYDDPNR